MDGGEALVADDALDGGEARSWLVTTDDGTASALARLRALVSRSGVSTMTAWHGTPAAVGQRPVARPDRRFERGGVDDRQQSCAEAAW